MEEKREEKVDRQKQAREDMKKVNKIIFFTNEEVSDDWTDFDLTPEEMRILKEGEDYVDKKLIPSLSISEENQKKRSKELDKEEEVELKDVNKVEREKEAVQEEVKSLDDKELIEIDSLLRAKARNLKLSSEKEDKYSKLKKEEEEKRRKELEGLHR